MNELSKEIEVPKIRPLPMKRINTRISQNQHKWIKAEAKKTGNTEGEIFREIIKQHIIKYKK